MSKVTISAALNKVNEGRESLGYQPLDKMPKGILSDPMNCPVHNAFGEHQSFASHYTLYIDSRSKARTLAKTWGTSVYDAGYQTEDNPRWGVMFPEEITDFIQKFDDGGFKTLVKNEV